MRAGDKGGERKKGKNTHLLPAPSQKKKKKLKKMKKNFHQGNLLLWSGVFYGLTQFRVHYVVPGPRRLRPGWAFYLSLGQTIAWLVASHVLARMPPVELVQAWTGNIAAVSAPAPAAAPAAAAAGSNGGEGSSSGAAAAPAAAPAPARASSVKLRPILGKLPSSLRNSLGKVPGVEIV